MPIDFTKQVGPFVGVQFDQQVRFIGNKSTRTFRVIAYQAYSARGLIGSEFNGVAVLNEDDRNVLCDCIAQCSSGYFGVSDGQLQVARDLCGLSWPEFRDFLNNHPRHRYLLESV
jgi:hypothetical protein